MIDVENILALAEFIEGSPRDFNMASFDNCIAAFGQTFFNVDTFEKVGTKLGLSSTQMMQMFYPDSFVPLDVGWKIQQIDKREAVLALRAFTRAQQLVFNGRLIPTMMIGAAEVDRQSRRTELCYSLIIPRFYATP